jgi:acyl-coenzyme A synthetase/AMP-(fatty) acid ligase
MVTLLDRVGDATVGFVARLGDHGGSLALASATEEVTYEALARRVADVAARLGSERRLVLVRAANRIDAVVAYLGVLAGGHVALVVPADGDERLEHLVRTFDPDAVVQGDGEGVEVVERRTGSAHVLHPELALLLSTSGSTGSPRLVRLSHASVDANATSIASYLGIDDGDRAVTSLPLHYCYGLSVLHSHLARGAGVVLTDLSVVDRCFWDLFRARRATSFAGVPHTFDLLDRVGFAELSLPSLRYVTQAGGRMAPEVVQRYAALGARDGWDLVVMYGQTEATARMAYLPPHLAAAHPWSIGVPIPGGRFDLAPVEGAGPDEGELVYAGPNVMLGYAEQPADLALGRTVEVLRTGDLARRHPDGLYEVIGRNSRFAKIAGLRIDLDHVERVLRADGTAVLCASDDERLVIGLEEGGTDLGAVAARAAAACDLPVGRVVAVDLGGPARLANGKPDHRAVLAAADETAAPAPLDGPPDVHPAVWSVLAHVLRVEQAAPTDTFVSLGGDSLSYVEVSIGLEEALGELPPDWHTTALADLRPRAVPRRLGRIETSVLVRALAIVLVVGTHVGTFQLLGGAHLLLGVAGWNYARFQSATADRLRSVARIALPSMAWLAVAALTVSPRIHLDHVLLVHGWLGDPDAHGGYWYIEAIAQILLALAALLAVPPVARLARRHPFGLPLALAGAGLAVRFGVVDLPTVEPHDIRSHDIFWLFALGWAGAAARSVRGRLLVSALLLAAVPGYFGEPQREVFVTLGLLAVLWLPTVALPRPLVRATGRVAAASLAIYLTHWQVFPPVRDAWGEPVALVAAVLAGVAGWSVLQGAGRWLVPRLAQRGWSPSDRRSYAGAGGPA